MKHYQELSFAKLDKDMYGKKVEANKYALFHSTFNTGLLGDPGRVLVNISEDYLMGYLEASLISSAGQDLFLYNGISTVARNGAYPKCKFSRIEDSKIEEWRSEMPKLKHKNICNK